MDSIEQQIKDLKDKIADARDYIGSDFCTNYAEMYKQREVLEQKLKKLEQELNSFRGLARTNQSTD